MDASENWSSTAIALLTAPDQETRDGLLVELGRGEHVDVATAFGEVVGTLLAVADVVRLVSPGKVDAIVRDIAVQLAEES